jgi:YD repeat-containing protein
MKTIRVIIHLCVTIINTISLSTYAQSPPPADAPRVVPATPNATKMTEYYAQRPNMYTGTASVNIPLYTIDFEGWPLPLSITYNATGIRTNEEAGEIGLGWALNATGVISRSVNGGDDLFRGPNGGNGGKGYVYDIPIKFDLGYVPHTDDAGPPDESYYKHLAMREPDTQPDVFNYNFFGYSGSFVLTQKTLGPIGAVKLTQDACVIQFNEQPSSFVIITPQGFKGYFDVPERTTSLSSYAEAGLSTDNWLTCCEENYIDIPYLTDKSGQFRVISSWYLSRIESPRGDVINFDYDLDVGNSSYVSLSKSFAEFGAPQGPRICLQTIHEHVYLKSIASDDIRIDFTMESRDDLRLNTLYTRKNNQGNPFPVGKKLQRYSSIHIDAVDERSTLNKTIIFVQSYFNQAYHNVLVDNEEEVRLLRSRLDRLKIEDREYNFYYADPGKLPDKLTSAIDHFGFYNGVEQFERMLLPPVPAFDDKMLAGGTVLADTSAVQFYTQRSSRRVNFDVGKYGLLTKVIYPTRGYSLFEYESHRYAPDQTIPFREISTSPEGTATGGARIRSIKDYDYNDSLALHKEYVYRESPSDKFSPGTGRLMTPLYNRYAAKYRNDYSNGFDFKYRTHSGIPGGSSAQGKIIGYSIVQEIVHGRKDSYRNVYYFENRPNHVSAYNAIATGWPNLNGQLIETINYDSEDKIVRRTRNSDYYHVEPDLIKGIVYEVHPNFGTVAMLLNYSIPYQLERTFITPRVVTTTTYSTNEGTSKETTTTTSYNSSYLVRSQESLNSAGDIVKTEFRRPPDYANPSPALRQMIQPTINIVDPVVEKLETSNGVTIGATANRYELDEKMHVNLTANYTWNPSLGAFKSSLNGFDFPAPYELKTSFDEFNSRGKILQFTGVDGITNSFVWGYRNKLPIVHGIGLSFLSLSAAYNAAVASFNPEVAIRNHGNTLGKQITTFTHNPLVGVSTVVDPNGLRKTFVYDSCDRLTSIIDNDGNTLEQYKYHFRERQSIKALSVPSTLDFGIQVQDFFQPTFYEYEKCGSPNRTLVVTNTGEEDVFVSRVELPAGYSCSWRGGRIASGVSVNILVKFNDMLNLAAGTYNGLLKIFSDTPRSVYTTDLMCELQTRNCNLTPLPATIDFGSTIGSFEKRQLTVTNNGTGSLKIVETPLNWDGGQNTSLYKVESFYVQPNPLCLSPLSSQAFDVAFTPPAIGQYSAVLSLVTDAGCPPVNVELRGKRRPPAEARMINITVAQSSVKITTEQKVLLPIRISNPGVYPLHVNDVVAETPDKTFVLSETKFDVEPGAEKEIMVSFQPGAVDFNEHTIRYIFVSDKTSGDNSVSITGRRDVLRKIDISTSSLNFTYANQLPKTISITNIGNQDLSFDGDGLSFVFGSPGGIYTVPENSSVYWSAQIANVGTPLRPGQSTTLSVRLLPGFDAPLRQFVKLDYSKTTGVPETYVELFADTKVLGYPSAITMESGDANFSRALTFFNYGNTPLEVKGYKSSDLNFSVTSQAFPIIIPPFGGKISLDVLYQSKDFSQHSTVLTLDCDATGFQSKVASVKITARRIMISQLTAIRPDNNTGNWTINFSQQAKTGSLKNTGNVALVINSISVSDTNLNAEEFKLELPPGTTLPVTLTPGASLLMTLKSNRGYSTTATGTITVIYERTKTLSIDVKRIIF